MKKVIELLKIKKKFLIGISISILCFVIDIATKRFAFKQIDLLIEKTNGVHSHIAITSFFNIVKVVNRGISFGLLNTIPYGQILLSIATLIIIIYVCCLLFKENDNNYIIIYSFIIGGGFGNLYDRVKFGGVFDFLDFHIKQYHWPAFNIADSLICIAIMLIVMFDFIKFIKKEKINN